MTRFEVTPSGPFDLENENRYFGGWPTVAGAVAMAFPVEGWKSSAAVAVTSVELGHPAIGRCHELGRHPGEASEQVFDGRRMEGAAGEERDTVVALVE
ncbi:MAG: hypothetical protein NVSMB17_11950 [Candidatus Dormibacteria bacterium]